ncbi:MAG: segregation/condensation protein A [Burkholderiales bacterium]|nr:segregation/condensation protein A [Burkholderiales bacterium]
MSLGATAVPVARVYGQPVLAIPRDLYIPPDALEVFLDQFEGPLDLLLYLIRKENISVLDIPMARLTAQYLEYVELMRSRSLELAAEYLLMAAVLIEIKSRMLLPRPARTGLEEDPRAELARRLIEYERIKRAARQLEELPQCGRDFAVAQALYERATAGLLPQVNADDLRVAWISLLGRAAVNRHHHITREQLSVRQHMSRVLRRLQDAHYLEFTGLFAPEEGVAVLVVTLLALLELARESLIDLTQQAPYAPIYVRLRNGQLTAVH